MADVQRVKTDVTTDIAPTGFHYGGEEHWRAGVSGVDELASDGPAPYAYGAEEAWAETSPRRRRRAGAWGPYGRRPITLLALVALIDAIDKGILPGVLTKVQEEFGFGDAQAGVLGTAFIFAGFLVVIPAGYLADRHRRTRIIAGVLVSWGVISGMNAAVQNYWQFLGVRAALGFGETIDNPSSQSLIADYYPPNVRGRAYAMQRIAPTVGTALGTGLGGLVAAIFGWRWAFLLVGVPGSLLAIAVWRLKEPRRGESDEFNTSDDTAETATEATTAHVTLEVTAEASELVTSAADAEAPEADPGSDVSQERTFKSDISRVIRIKTLRSLIVGTAIAAGATQGLGFWAPAFYERHSGLTSGQAAAVTAGAILSGALSGTYLGGLVSDRAQSRAIAGAPMLIAGYAQFAGGVLLMLTFLPVPLWFRVPAQIVGVALLVAGFPALTSMIAQVVPASIRGIAFSVTSFLGAVSGALSPLVIGIVSEQYSFSVDGVSKGHLANSFLTITPLVLFGALVVLRGRRWVGHDLAVAAAERRANRSVV